VDPVPNPLLLRKSASAGNRTPGRGTRYRSRLRRYATSRKVADSILDEVIGFFQFA
jgi:hypothetical protein